MPPAENARVRDCVAADAEALSLAACGTFAETYAGMVKAAHILAHCRTQLSVAKFAGYFDGTDAHFALAEIREAPVGYAMVCSPDLPMEIRPGDMELKRIYLFHRFQGSGLGRMMMQWAVERARSLGSKRLLLGVNDENWTALDFYARQGFVLCGTRKFQVGDGQYSDVLLSRDL